MIFYSRLQMNEKGQEGEDKGGPNMDKKRAEKAYLGDGLHVEDKGYQFELSTERDGGVHWVALDDGVLDALFRFVERHRGVVITMRKNPNLSILERQFLDVQEALAYYKSDNDRLRADVDKIKLTLGIQESKSKG